MGNTTAVNFMGAGCIYNRINSNPSIGLPASGIGNIPSFIATNTGNTPVTATVNPVSAAPPSIAASQPTGTIYACEGSASASPQIEQFTITGSTLNGAVTATAPSGFEVSLTAGSGYGSSVTLTPVNGAVNGVTIYVRSAASATVGNISGNVIISSPGAANQMVAVTGVVNTLPTVNQVANQTVLTGAITTPVIFSGSNNTVFNWINSTTAIGLPATGSGNIGSFTAVNNGSSPIVATITATPVSEGFAYICNAGDGTVSIINVATNTVVSKITPQHDPACVCISPDGSKAYIGCSDGSSTVAVVNTLTNSIINTISVSSSGESTGITVTPDGKTLYVANYVDNTVTAVSTVTGSVIAVIPVGQNPYGIAITPDGSKVYVAFTYSNYISVISTATNTATANITVGQAPADVAVSSDGSKVYVPVSNSSSIAVIDPTTNSITTVISTGGAGAGVIALSADGTRAYVAAGLNNVLVINTTTNTVISTITVGTYPNAISVSPDGQFAYVVNSGSKNVSVINTSTNTVIATINVGIAPVSLGNFVTGGTGCTGNPTTFTITVNPAVPINPTITTGNVSGSIYSCLGTASLSPNIQQFTVSGSNLNGNISAVAPSGFEISASANSGYSSGLTLAATTGAISTTTIYVRTTASASAGNLTGLVTLTSPGATSVNVPVQGTVNPAATVNVVQSQTVTNGSQTAAIDFTGTATSYNWINNTPGIGLAASGSGDISSFTAINTGSAPVTATITVTPVTAGGPAEGDITCTGVPITFTITVNAVVQSAITAQGTLQPLTTTYGKPSSATVLNIAGSSLTEGILVNPPSGFEESTDNVTFGTSLTVGITGNITATPVYFRLAATTPVGQYSGNIVLTSGSVTPIEVAMPAGIVTPAPLTIIADNKSKVYGTPNPVLTASFTGFVNNERAAVLTDQPALSTTAVTLSPVGQYPIRVSGAQALNYSISYVNGILTVLPPDQDTFVPNAFTPNGDGINDTWNIKFADSNCTVNIFNRWGQTVFSSIGYGIPWDGNYRGTPLPAGTYYYIINFDSGVKVLAGYVAIIR